MPLLRTLWGPDDQPLGVRLATRLVVALGLAYLGTYLVCALIRLVFPWEIEWMEGGMIMHAARVLADKPIYAPPSLDFVAFFYTPLYAYVLAGLSHVSGGLSFALGRGVSLAASLATMGMLFYAGKREAGVLAGLLAAGLYAALFRTCGAFYDVARADSLALAIALGACLVAYYVPSKRGAALAALLFIAAFFAKQTAALPAPLVGAYLLSVDRRRAFLFGGIGVVLGAISFYLLDRHYDGWLRFYTVTGHQGHEFYSNNFLLEFWRDVLFLAPFLLLLPALGASYGRVTRWLVLPFLLLFSVVFVLRAQTLDYDYHMYYAELWYERVRPLLLIPPLALALAAAVTRWLRRDVQAPPVYFLLLFVAGALASDLNHSTQWAYSNCFMPIATFGSLYAALSFSALTSAPLDKCRRHERAAYALCSAMVLQLVALYYFPRREVPTARDYTALAEVLARVDAQPGPVLMPAHPLYSYLRDGTIHLHQMGIGDVEFAGGLNDFAARLSSGEFPTVVDDLPIDGLENSYEKMHAFSYDRGALKSKTGFWVRPTGIWLHRSRVSQTP